MALINRTSWLMTASTQFGGNLAEYATDGDAATCWAAQIPYAGPGEYLKADMGLSYPVSRITATGSNPGAGTSGRIALSGNIQTSPDGSTWTTAYSWTSSDITSVGFVGEKLDVTFGSPITTRYFRLVATANNTDGSGFQVFELNAYTNVATSASFVSDDTATKGNWIGVYGADGFRMANYLVPNAQANVNGNFAYESSAELPSYAAVSLTGNNVYVWDDLVNGDPRKMQRPSGLDPLASCWYTSASNSSYDLNISVGPTTRQIGLYLMDFDGSGSRGVDVQVVDPESGSTLTSTRNYTGTTYGLGIWALYQISGNVKFTILSTGTINGVVSMLAFDTPGGGGPSPKPWVYAQAMRRLRGAA